MTTLSLPDRLRAVADLIEQHDLPDRNVHVSGGQYAGYVSVSVEGRDEIDRWAAALDTVPAVCALPADERGRRRCAHLVIASGGQLLFHVQWTEHDLVAVTA